MVMVYLRLFYEFFKAGLFAIGGGLATLPFLSSMADKTGWFTQSELADMIAVSESTPGAIGINMATYAGFKTGRDSGGADCDDRSGLPVGHHHHADRAVPSVLQR